MRFGRVALLLMLLALPLVLAPSAGALDLEVDVKPPPGEVGTPYEFEFEGEEGCLPYRFSYLNGTVPPGLQITTDGKLTGTPTTAGTFSFWVALDDNGGSDNPYCLDPSVQSQGEFTMIVMPDLAVATTSLPSGTPGTPYSVQLQFTNPEAGWPVTWDITAGSLPSGLTLSESGLISGTPAGADRKTFTVRAREPFRRFGEQELTLTIAARLTAASRLGPGEVGLRYAGSITSSGGTAPLTWSVANGDLPAGLTLDPATGTLRGIPQAAGLYALTFAVADSGGQQANVPAVLRVAARLAISTSRLPAGKVGARYKARVRASGGLAPKQWRIVRGSLPRGVRLNATTGALAGVARSSGVFRFTVMVRDRIGGRSAKALRLTVRN